MEHVWQPVIGEPDIYRRAIELVAGEPDLRHEPDDPQSPPFSMLIDGGWFPVDVVATCSRCGALLFSDAGDDYVAVAGGDCEGARP